MCKHLLKIHKKTTKFSWEVDAKLHLQVKKGKWEAKNKQFRVYSVEFDGVCLTISGKKVRPHIRGTWCSSEERLDACVCVCLWGDGVGEGHTLSRRRQSGVLASVEGEEQKRVSGEKSKHAQESAIHYLLAFKQQREVHVCVLVCMHWNFFLTLPLTLWPTHLCTAHMLQTDLQLWHFCRSSSCCITSRLVSKSLLLLYI